MRETFPDKLEAGRLLHGAWASRPGSPYGAFDISGPCAARLFIVATDGQSPEGEGWEHVSVSTRRRIPNWLEMCFVKDLFWSEDEWIVQFHPARSEYVNNHPNVLHLWRKPGFPTPPSHLVGDKTRGELTPEQTLSLRALT